ncbi:MAG: four helix bundle protein [Verrucomicrobiota bacterium]
MMSERVYDLQERFVDFSVRVIRVCDALPETRAGKHICGQLLRSGTSPAPNYGEAQSAESTADFVHKSMTALTELGDTDV